MKSTPAAVLLSVLALFPIASAQAQDAPKPLPAVGHRLAVEVCSACHLIPGQPPGSGGAAPSFVEIANRPDTSAASLRAFMTTPHFDEHRIAMNSSNAMLTPEQQDDLIDYILSLKSSR